MKRILLSGASGVIGPSAVAPLCDPSHGVDRRAENVGPTFGDGLVDLDRPDLLELHEGEGRLGTVGAAHRALAFAERATAGRC